jgi:hypothetical protein
MRCSNKGNATGSNDEMRCNNGYGEARVIEIFSSEVFKIEFTRM